MTNKDLESPSSVEALYTSRGDDVDEYRPVFTGDVFIDSKSPQDSIDTVILVQHPCALRTKGNELVPFLLAAQVCPVRQIRTDWSNESYRLMPLPELFDDEKHWAADMTVLSLVPAERLQYLTRVAVLSLHGVNLLSQRWVYHNSRVAIPTIKYNEQTLGPYEEADLAAEWIAQLVDSNHSPDSLEADFHEWIRAPWADGQVESRQTLLYNPQHRSEIRRSMNAEIRTRLE